MDGNVLDLCPVANFFVNGAVKALISSSREVCYSFCNICDESIFWPRCWIIKFCILGKLSAHLHLVKCPSLAKTSWEIFYKSVNKKKWRKIHVVSFAVLIEGQIDSSYIFSWIFDVRIDANMRALNLVQRRCWNLNSSGKWLCVVWPVVYDLSIHLLVLPSWYRIKKVLFTLTLLLPFWTWGTTGSTTAPSPRKIEYSFANLRGVFFPFTAWVFKQKVCFFFRETVIFVVSQASFKVGGNYKWLNHWISGRRRGFVRHEANTKFGVARWDISYFARIGKTSLGFIKRWQRS